MAVGFRPTKLQKGLLQTQLLKSSGDSKHLTRPLYRKGYLRVKP